MPRTSFIPADSPDSSEGTITLLLLLCDVPIPSVFEEYGTYHDVFTSFFANSYKLFESEASTTARGKRLKRIEVIGYDVVKDQEYPGEEELKRANAVVMTGSAASAYAPIPWITRLVSFIRSLPNSHPSLKIIGICFGHQIVAQAFAYQNDQDYEKRAEEAKKGQGKATTKNLKGWELGVRQVELSELGAKVFAKDGEKSIRIHEVHQDHVPTLPPQFHSLGSTIVSPIQGMIKLFNHDDSKPSSVEEDRESLLSSINTFCLQGHPEFTADIVGKIIDTREAGGIIDHELAERSRAFAKERDDGIELGKTILTVVGV